MSDRRAEVERLLRELEVEIRETSRRGPDTVQAQRDMTERQETKKRLEAELERLK